MTLREILKKYSAIEIEILLEHVLKKPKEFLFMHPETKLTAAQLVKLDGYIKRRIKGEPIAYLVGYKYFYGLKFKVTKDTLIPRPETEWLVDQVIKLGAGKKILDMGTGSGCIAISIAKNIKTHIHAADISSGALSIAKQNAKLHHAKVMFFKSNLFSNLPYKYDFIIANLPYVPVADYKKLKGNLKHEPKSALTDGTKTGDKIISNFLKQAKDHLNPGGKIFLEIDPSQIKAFVGYPAKIYKDLKHLDRYAIIDFKSKST